MRRGNVRLGVARFPRINLSCCRFRIVRTLKTAKFYEKKRCEIPEKYSKTKEGLLRDLVSPYTWCRHRPGAIGMPRSATRTRRAAARCHPPRRRLHGSRPGNGH